MAQAAVAEVDVDAAEERAAVPTADAGLVVGRPAPRHRLPAGAELEVGREQPGIDHAAHVADIALQHAVVGQEIAQPGARPPGAVPRVGGVRVGHLAVRHHRAEKRLRLDPLEDQVPAGVDLEPAEEADRAHLIAQVEVARRQGGILRRARKEKARGATLHLEEARAERHGCRRRLFVDQLRRPVAPQPAVPRADVALGAARARRAAPPPKMSPARAPPLANPLAATIASAAITDEIFPSRFIRFPPVHG